MGQLLHAAGQMLRTSPPNPLQSVASTRQSDGSVAPPFGHDCSGCVTVVVVVVVRVVDVCVTVVVVRVVTVVDVVAESVGGPK